MSQDERDGITSTGRLSDDVLARLQREAQRRPGELSLLLFARDGARVVPLLADCPVVIGRAAPATVTVRDSSLSREHASVELVGDEVRVVDLGSTNGTWLDGVRKRRFTAGSGVDLAFGSVPATVQDLTPPGAGAGIICSHDAFMAQASVEVERARAFGRSFALLVLRSLHGEPSSRWASSLRAALRPFDLAGLYAPSTLEVLLPEADESAALATARPLAAAGSLSCGLALYPSHGSCAEELLQAALQALRSAGPSGTIQLARSAATDSGGGGDDPLFISPGMLRVRELAERLAAARIPVLLTGETGTGKEVVARAIHAWGKRAEARMVCVNCGAIPAQLVESTLFGHEAGAFTGANQQRAGVFESADGGTVLLDEVGELPAPAQAALLRVLETRRFCRVGSSREIEVDVRIIAATHRDLEAMCREGGFRWDLLYRLNSMTLRIPPLRERREEIEPLALGFLARAAADCGRTLSGIAPEARRLLERYHWPGNLRELRNAMERAAVIACHDRVTTEDLPLRVQELSPAQPTGGEPDLGVELDEGADLKTTLARREAALIMAALERAGWDRSRAAEALGLPLRTLAHKMKTHGIKRGGYQRG